MRRTLSVLESAAGSTTLAAPAAAEPVPAAPATAAPPPPISAPEPVRAPAPEVVPAPVTEAGVEEYDELDVEEVIAILPALERPDLEQLRSYEAANRSRDGLLAAIDSVLARSRG